MKTDKETGIMYRQWTVPDPEAVFLLVHGLGAHSARWEFLSSFFLQSGIASYALELEGFGETTGPRGHIDSFNAYYDDIRSLRDIIARENPGKKIYLLGESLGALISFLAAIEEPRLFNGLICISPAFKTRMKASIPEYVRIACSLIYYPRRQFEVPFDSGMCTRDTDYREVMDSDPREHRIATSKFLFKTIAAQLRGGILKGKLKLPVLFLLSGDDKLTDPAASRKVFSRLKIKDKSIIEYPEMYHALSIDLGREDVFRDILKWVRDRI